MPLQVSPEAEKCLEGDVAGDPGGEDAIAVRKLSICEKETPPTRSQSTYRVKPASHSSGAPHTVTVGLVLLMTAFTSDALLDLARKGTVSCRVEWSFLTCHSFPKFTTIHLLVLGDGAHISFGGGLSRFREIHRRFNPPQPHTSASRELQGRGASQENTEVVSQLPSSRAEPTVPPAGNTSDPSVVPVSISSFSLGHGQPQRPRHSGLWMPPQDNLLSALHRPLGGFPWNTQDTSAASHFGQDNALRDDIDQPNTPGSLTTATTRQSTPDQDSDATQGGNWVHEQPKYQDHLDLLSRQRQEAERLYNNTGNSSALFSVLDSAARDSEAWHPSGFSRF
ncbi:hypothetical protein B0T16DRAFT_211526 [Cercophora newfieldiana]|uniref:Uncharacterized protein n=1 Tax=Cercophora newfieldiana TaxID=92897 RepID=A0AA39XVW7_9PEZI|nr:hypothetical protein B0T16DRAFT_211526 [Cercophora newfieldiana]